MVTKLVASTKECSRRGLEREGPVKVLLNEDLQALHASNLASLRRAVRVPTIHWASGDLVPRPVSF